MVTCCSCITSSRADWTLAGARLISSARRKLQKTGPSSVSKVPRSTVDPDADEVAGHEVRGELDPAERGVEDVGQGLDRQGLGEARNALEEEMAARQQGDEDPLEHGVLADDDPADLVQDRLGGLPGVDEAVDAVARGLRGAGRSGRGRGGAGREVGAN